VCGDGVVEPGEECDERLIRTARTGARASCASELIPGGGVTSLSAQECFQEWLAPPVVVRDGEGMPSRRLVCEDDDPNVIVARRSAMTRVRSTSRSVST